jgi:wobble nucleotide-excising tRNase
LQDFEEASAACNEQNKKIQEANERIDALKKSAAAADEKEVEAKLRTLRNSQIRHQPEVAILCQTLTAHRAERRRLTQEKDRARQDLEGQAGQVLTEYEASINRYLEKFGASFKMTGAKPHFPGGKASSVYQIEINGQPVDLGDSRTKAGTVCFRTALSTGDRSTLALAFFLARLDRDPNLGTKAIVFDDPLSSLDCFRSACTQQELSRLAMKAEQLIVMSHDAAFLKSLYDEDPSAKTLHIVRRSSSHELEPWDIEDHCRSQAHRDYFMLKSFLLEGVPKGMDLASVARRIRPYVEDYLRHKYPGAFTGNVMLGHCIQTIRAAAASDVLAHLRPKVSDLEDINDFGKRFMHADESRAQVTEQELQNYAKRAIAFVQGS